MRDAVSEVLPHLQHALKDQFFIVFHAEQDKGVKIHYGDYVGEILCQESRYVYTVRHKKDDRRVRAGSEAELLLALNKVRSALRELSVKHSDAA